MSTNPVCSSGWTRTVLPPMPQFSSKIKGKISLIYLTLLSFFSDVERDSRMQDFMESIKRLKEEKLAEIERVSKQTS